MLVGEHRVFPPTCFLEGTIDYPLRGISNLAGCDIEIFYVHVSVLRLTISNSKTQASPERPIGRRAWPTGHPERK
jgi:hypothetical protein